jgi:hypothetical protein
MLLLLRKTLRNAVTLCALEKIRKPITAEKRLHEKTIDLKGERTHMNKFVSKVEKKSITQLLTPKPHKPISLIPMSY